MSFEFAAVYGPQPITNAAGRPLTNLPVDVFLTGTRTLAPLWTDRTKTTPADNPTTTDDVGNLTFFADPGEYDVEGNSATITVTLYMDPAEPITGDATGTLPGVLTLQDTTNVQDVMGTVLDGIVGGLIELALDEAAIAATASPSVQAIGVANVTLASPGATFGGFTLTNSGTDRVLLTAQTTGSENGLWIWNGATSPLTRPFDYPNGATITGRVVLVSNGTGDSHDDELWTMANGSVMVDTDPTTWSMALSGTYVPLNDPDDGFNYVMPAPANNGFAITDTANFNAALVASGSVITGTPGNYTATGGAGIIVFRAAPASNPYVMNADVPVIDGTSIGLRGPGYALCNIEPSSAVGSGHQFLRFTNSSFSGTTDAAPISGFRINMINTTGAVGFSIGDRTGQSIQDVLVENATGTGAAAFLFDNAHGWMERSTVNVLANTSSTLFVFDRGSFDYSDWTLTGTAIANQVHTQIGPGNANLFGGSLNIHGNCSAGTGSNTGVGFLVNGSSAIVRCALHIDIESNGTSGQIGHQCINTVAGSIIETIGRIQMPAFGGPTWVASAASGQFTFAGFVYVQSSSDTLFNTVHPNTAFQVYGGSTDGIFGSIPTSGTVNIGSRNVFATIVHSTGLTNMVAGSTLNITFSPAAPAGAAARYTFIFVQPASGSPAVLGTVPWTWEGPKTLQLTNGAMDIVEVRTYDGVHFVGTVITNPSGANSVPLGTVTFVTTSTTFTIPGTGTQVWEIGCAGGGGSGGGGGGGASNIGGGAGASGVPVFDFFTVTGGTVMTVTRGAGGTSVAATLPGVTGGTTTVAGTGVSLSAPGGTGGAGAPNATNSGGVLGGVPGGTTSSTRAPGYGGPSGAASGGPLTAPHIATGGGGGGQASATTNSGSGGAAGAPGGVPAAAGTTGGATGTNTGGAGAGAADGTAGGGGGGGGGVTTGGVSGKGGAGYAWFRQIG